MSEFRKCDKCGKTQKSNHMYVMYASAEGWMTLGIEHGSHRQERHYCEECAKEVWAFLNSLWGEKE